MKHNPNPITVGPIHLTHITPHALYARLNHGRLVALWSYDPITSTPHYLDVPLDLSPHDWDDAQSRARLALRLLTAHDPAITLV